MYIYIYIYIYIYGSFQRIDHSPPPTFAKGEGAFLNRI